MRVTVVEGTTEEILLLFPHLAELKPEASVRVGQADDSLPEDVREVLALARSVDRGAVDRFTKEVVSWGGVHVAAGHRHAGGLTPYVRFHRRGGGDASAFAYLFPGRMYVRPHLQADHLAGARFAARRGGKAADGVWSRNLALSPEEAWDEALSYTRAAYDAAGE